MNSEAPHKRRTDPAELSARAFPAFLAVSLVLHGAALGGLVAYGVTHPSFAAEGRDDVAEAPISLDLREFRAQPVLPPAEPTLTVQDAPEPAEPVVVVEPFDPAALPEFEVESTVVASSAPPIRGEPSAEVAWIGVGSGPIAKLERRGPVTAAGGSGDGNGDGGRPDGVDGTTGGAGVGSPEGTGLVPSAPPPPDTPAIFESGAEPTYPKMSRRLSEEGSVVLRVAVDASGAVTDVVVQTTRDRKSVV
jgi:outer membrane biosynthesis protein TonB